MRCTGYTGSPGSGRSLGTSLSRPTTSSTEKAWWITSEYSLAGRLVAVGSGHAPNVILPLLVIASYQRGHEVNKKGKEVKHNKKQSTKGLDKKGHGTNIPYLCALRLYV